MSVLEKNVFMGNQEYLKEKEVCVQFVLRYKIFVDDDDLLIFFGYFFFLYSLKIFFYYDNLFDGVFFYNLQIYSCLICFVDNIVISSIYRIQYRRYLQCFV